MQLATRTFPLRKIRQIGRAINGFGLDKPFPLIISSCSHGVATSTEVIGPRHHLSGTRQVGTGRRTDRLAGADCISKCRSADRLSGTKQVGPGRLKERAILNKGELNTCPLTASGNGKQF